MLQIVVVDEDTEVLWSGELDLKIPVKHEDGLDEFQTQDGKALVFSAGGSLPLYQLSVRMDREAFLGAIAQKTLETRTGKQANRWFFDCSVCHSGGQERGYGSHATVLDAMAGHFFRSHTPLGGTTDVGAAEGN